MDKDQVEDTVALATTTLSSHTEQSDIMAMPAIAAMQAQISTPLQAAFAKASQLLSLLLVLVNLPDNPAILLSHLGPALASTIHSVHHGSRNLSFH
jgi:hypothetical protein